MSALKGLDGVFYFQVLSGASVIASFLTHSPIIRGECHGRQSQKSAHPALPPEDVRSRQGHNGTRLHFVEAWRVTERLNEALSHEWSFEILEHAVMDDEVLVKAELSCAGIRRQAFGSSSITRVRETNAAVCLGDDLKRAAEVMLENGGRSGDSASALGVDRHRCVRLRNQVRRQLQAPV